MAKPPIVVQIKGGATKVTTGSIVPPVTVQVKGGATKVTPAIQVSATRLVELSDVQSTPVTDQDVLTWVSANSKFEFQPQVSGSATDQVARNHANGAFNHANTANVTAQAAFNQANGAIYTAAQIRANISNTAPINYAPVTGIISHADSGAVATTYGNSTFVATVTVDVKGHVTGATNTAISFPPDAVTSVAGKTGIVLLDTNDIAENLSSNLWFTAARVRANISNTSPINYVPTTGVVSHADSTVTPTTYGNTTFIPTITVDSKGHVTSVVNTAITFPVDTNIDQFARDHSNGAFDKANTANVTGQAAFDKANSNFTLATTANTVAASAYAQANIATTNADAAFARANAAYSNANTAIYTAAQIRSNISNTAPINYDSSTGIISHALSGVVSTTYGNTTFVPQVTIDNKGHVTSASNVAITFPPDQYARDKANGAAQQSFVTVNVAGQSDVVTDSNTDTLTLIAGTGIVLTTDAPNDTITITASGGSSIDQFARDHSNGAFDKANTANVTGQAAFDKANGAIYTAAQIRANISNTAPINYDATTGIISHADSGAVATAYGNSTFVATVTVDAKGHVTSVVNTAINFPPSGVTSVAGKTGAVLLDTYDISENLSSNLWFTAARVRANVSNTTPINYDPATGIISHALSGVTATGYGDAATVAKVVVDTFGHVTSVTNTTIAISAAAVTSGILAVARGGTGKDATGLANGQIFIGNTVNTGFDLTVIAQTAPVIVVNGRGTITLSHASSGIIATGYGTAALVPVFVVDAFGHITSVTNTAIAGLDAGVITTGTLVVARGGTGQTSYTNGQILIGNTGSTGLDKATIAQSAPVIVTNLQGSITISHARSGVVAVDSYGSPAIVPVIAVDANGHITAAVNTTIAIAGSQITHSAANLASLTVSNMVIRATGGGSLEIGQPGVVFTPFIDFHSSASSTDFDVRQIVSDGTANIGEGTFTQTAGVHVFNTSLAGVVGQAFRVVTLGGATVNYVQAYGGTTGNSATLQAAGADANVGLQLATKGSGTVTFVGDVILPASSITSGTLAVARGGTGKDATGLANGQLLIGNTVSGGFDVNAITQGSGISITNDKGSITIAATATTTPYIKSIAVTNPVVTDNITFFFTQTAITFLRVMSVVAGSTPNVVFNLTYANTRTTGTVGTNITGNITCANTSNGVSTTAFTNATVPANNYVVLQFSTVSGTVSEISITMLA